MTGERAHVKFTTPKGGTVEMKGTACPGWMDDYLANHLDNLEAECTAVWKLDGKETTKEAVEEACCAGSLNRLEPGTYHVVKVRCTATECINRFKCNEEGFCAQVGLKDRDNGIAIVCRDYSSRKGEARDRKTVFWERV